MFYCEATKEIFLDYDAFFQRTILCNSLVWSCSVTGKHIKRTNGDALFAQPLGAKVMLQNGRVGGVTERLPAVACSDLPPLEN